MKLILMEIKKEIAFIILSNNKSALIIILLFINQLIEDSAELYDHVLS